MVITDESGKEAAPGFAPPHPSDSGSNNKEEIAPWRRPGSLRARPTNRYTCNFRNHIFDSPRLSSTVL